MPENERDDLFVYGRDSRLARDHFAHAQLGRCAICKRVEQLVVDHEHSDEALCRGLLCSACNAGLGFFADDVVRLTAAIDYLNGHIGRTEAYRRTTDWELRRVKVTATEQALADAQRREDIVRGALAGSRPDELAARYGVSLRTVYRILEEPE